MIVKCSNCGASYNATERYFGKSFTCPCSATVNVPKPPEPKPAQQTPQPKPAPQASQPKPAQPSQPKPKPNPTPARKPVAPASNRKSLMDVLAHAPLSSIGLTLSDIRGFAAGKQTIYGLMAQISSVACFLALLVMGMGMWKTLDRFYLVEEKALAFVATFIPAMFVVIFLFAVGTAILRIADCACRASGVRPTLF